MAKADCDALLDGPECKAGPIEVIARATGVYANLGTSSDAPRSVAICPQRKCVAFGCRSGIELHWKDHTTATSLNRWFPLAAPSDHLFFLPQRVGVDSTKKLRLISSADGPPKSHPSRRESAPTKWTFKSTSARHGRLQSMTRLFFGSMPFPSALTRRGSSTLSDDNERQGVLRTVDCDHYFAVPVSDGQHILFTDPATGLLCFGSDAPLGGPTKLMRKVCMVPPSSDSPEKASDLICYRAGSDLSFGVRVVAAYDDGRVILYNIPVDCFERIRHIRSTPDVWDELAGVVGESDLLMDVFMSHTQDHRLSQDSEDGTALSRQSSNSSTASRSFRSIQIDGSVIFQAPTSIEDVQVDCTGGGVQVWVFMQDCTAVRLKMYTPRHFTPAKRYVGVDGLIHDFIGDKVGPKRPRRSSNYVAGKGKAPAEESDDEPAREEDVDKDRHGGQVKFVILD